jgi:DNA-binding MurR/RpiR family transcriptional regulator
MDLDTANVINFARERGAGTFVFTASPVSAAALEAEASIICPGPTQTDVPSFTGLAAMIVVVITAFAVRHPDEADTMTGAVRRSYRRLLDKQEKMTSELNVEDLWRQF